jgi:iron(III) transport system permease protein
VGFRVLVAAAALPFAGPFVYLIIRAGRGDADWEHALGERTLGPLWRTLILGGSVAVAAAALGTAVAWLVARTDLPGRRVWAVLLALPLVIPSFIGAFALIAAFSRGGLLERLTGLRGLESVSGFWGAFGVLVLLTYPYVYLPVAARLRALPPSMEESARLLGRGAVATFRTVVLPQAWTAVLAGALLVFLYTISEFGLVQLLRYDTLTRAIYANRVLDPPVSITMSLILGALAIAIVALERALARRRPGPPRREGRALVVPLGRWRAGALGLVGGVVGLALVAPVGVLAYWALRGLGEGSSRSGALVANPGDLIQPAVNTSIAGLLAAACAVAVVLPVAYYTVRGRGRAGAAANAVVVGGFALPGLVIALALVFWTLGAPPPFASLYQTLPLLVGAYVLHFGALALGTAQVAVAGIPPALEDAARVLGRGRARRFLQIELPLMAPGLAAGAGLVLLSAMKELPATLLLAPAGFPTLATRIWSAAEDAFWADASLAALALVAVSGVLTWLLLIRRGRAVV